MFDYMMTKEQIQVMNGIANILRKKQSKQSATVNLMPKMLPVKKKFMTTMICGRRDGKF
jgi:hypothetical protein